MGELDIKERQVGDVTILDLDGELLLGDSGYAFRMTVSRLIEERKKNVVLDLERLKYINSGGVCELISAYTNVCRLGGQMKLGRISEKLQDILVITKLLTVFDVYESVEEAVASISDTASSYIMCPVHGCRQLTPFFDPKREGVCVNCGTEINVEAMYPMGISITSLLLPTYEGEFITILPGTPTTISIDGRLDLFSSEMLEKAWLTVRTPRRIIFRLEKSSEISPPGMQELLALCAQTKKDSISVILASSKIAKASFAAGAPVYDKEREAIAALGDISASANWILEIQTQ